MIGFANTRSYLDCLFEHLPHAERCDEVWLSLLKSLAKSISPLSHQHNASNVHVGVRDMSVKVLVHIAAPSLISDDKLYIAIAQKVLDFEPAVLTNVADLAGGNVPHSEVGVFEPDQPQCVGEIDSPDPRRGLNDTSKAARSSISPFPAGNHKLALKNGSAVSKGFRPRSRPGHQRGQNPPYKSPLRTPPGNGNPIKDSGDLVTSDIDLTATVTSSRKILAPETVQQSRKRTWSEVARVTDGDTVIANSQTVSSTRSPLIFDGQYSLSDSISLYAYREATAPEPSGVSPPPRPGAQCEHVEAGIACLVQSTSNIGSNDTTITASNQGTTAPPVGIRSICTEITADNAYASEIPGEIGSTVEEQDVSASHRPLTSTTPTTWGSAVSLSSSLAPLQILAFELIKQLPLLINSPQTDFKQFCTGIQNLPILKATAKALEYPQRFVPHMMTRQVSSLERGYWTIPFEIITSDKEQLTRLINTKILRRSGTALQSSLLKYPQLTEDEFLTIWNDLDKYISSGNAGWNVRVIRRKFSAKRGKNAVDDEAHFHLQVYCYGEMIPYIYALLLLCTRMYVMCKPVKWVSTIDEQPIITMTGEQRRPGNLSRWRRLEKKHGRQFWGMGIPELEAGLE